MPDGRSGNMDDPYAALREHFSTIEGVEINTGRGSQGMKTGGKMFVMFYKGQILVKLSPDRVAEVIEGGDGQAFDPGTGIPMRDRVLIPDTKKDLWIQYAEESRKYQVSL
jgi:hypothetical protein